VDTRTIRDKSGRKKLGRETTAADPTIARIPKVGLLQPQWQLLRYLLSGPCRRFLSRETLKNPVADADIG